MPSLKNKTITGLIWSSIEQFSVQGIQFIMGLVLARILLPTDYGMIGMLAIFIAISQSVIDSGFSSALIQKKIPTNNDYSTVFYFNFAVSLLIYGILYVLSPYIANFYNIPLLSDLTRIIGINIIISSFSIVQTAKLTKKLDFKTQAKASLSAVVISGFVGIYMAYSGYGVWALVSQTLTRSIINAIMLWIVTKWKPNMVFSKESIKTLFAFGSKMMYSGIIATIFDNLYIIVIGKVYQADQLGYYTRANQLQQFPSKNITSIIQRVTFPVLSSLQDDNDRLITSYRKVIRFSSFITFPLMLILAVVATPMIHLLLTDKWIQSASYLQLLCFAGLLYPIHSINLNILKVKGRSDLFLKLEIFKKVLFSIILLCTFSFGIKAMIIGQIIFSIIALVMNTHYTSLLIKYSLWSQLKDLLPIFLLAFLNSGIVYLSIFFINSAALKLSISLIFGLLLYYTLASILKFPEINEVNELLNRCKSHFYNKSNK